MVAEEKSKKTKRFFLSFWYPIQGLGLIAHAPEIPYLRLRSHQELWSRSWHGWFLEQSFLVQNLFYNDIFVDVFFRGRDCDRKVSWLFVEYKHICTKWSFAVSSMCLAHHAVRLWCSPRRWPRGSTNPVQIHLNCATFPSLIPGKMAVFDKTESLWYGRLREQISLSQLNSDQV